MHSGLRKYSADPPLKHHDRRHESTNRRQPAHRSITPPLVPPTGSLEELIHGLGPTASPAPERVADDELVYGVCTVGQAGRVLDRHLFTALGWAPGTHLHIEPVDDILLIRPHPHGPVRLTPDRFFRVPYRQRRRVHLYIGDRVLLTGHRSHGHLLLHPPTAVEALFSARLSLLDGTP